jgi:hypothetical protein
MISNNRATIINEEENNNINIRGFMKKNLFVLLLTMVAVLQPLLYAEEADQSAEVINEETAPVLSDASYMEYAAYAAGTILTAVGIAPYLNDVPVTKIFTILGGFGSLGAGTWQAYKRHTEFEQKLVDYNVKTRKLADGYLITLRTNDLNIYTQEERLKVSEESFKKIQKDKDEKEAALVIALENKRTFADRIAVLQKQVDELKKAQPAGRRR